MHVLYPLLICFFILAGLGRLLWTARLQATVALVLDKGGLYLDYSAGLGASRLTGFRLRMMPGHSPRAWKRILLTGIYRPAAAGEIFRKTTSKRWNPLQIPFRSAVGLGLEIELPELMLRVKAGVEDDAAATALLCGSITALAHAVCAAGARGMPSPRHVVSVRPVFGRARLSLHLKAVVAVQVGSIVRNAVKYRKRGKKKREKPGNPPGGGR
jgi:hypothetical protein